MNYEELTNIIKLAPKENEQWDFKEKWHESNGELLRDIINFANTPSHSDAYIIRELLVCNITVAQNFQIMG